MVAGWQLYKWLTNKVNTCRRCSQSIPTGRNFCSAHYQEALSNYNEQYDIYIYNLNIWNNLSDVDKTIANINAESNSLRNYSLLLGCIIGGILIFILDKSYLFEFKYKILFFIIFPIIFYFTKPIHFFVGKFMRCLIMGVLYLIVMCIIGWITSFWAPIINENISLLFFLGCIISISISSYFEMNNRYHASAQPTPPSKPSP